MTTGYSPPRVPTSSGESISSGIISSDDRMVAAPATLINGTAGSMSLDSDSSISAIVPTGTSRDPTTSRVETTMHPLRALQATAAPPGLHPVTGMLIVGAERSVVTHEGERIVGRENMGPTRDASRRPTSAARAPRRPNSAARAYTVESNICRPSSAARALRPLEDRQRERSPKGRRESSRTSYGPSSSSGIPRATPPVIMDIGDKRGVQSIMDQDTDRKMREELHSAQEQAMKATKQTMQIQQTSRQEVIKHMATAADAVS